MHLELAVRSVQRQVIAFQQLHFTGMVSGAEHVRHFNIELAEILCGHSIGQVKPDIHAPCGEAVSSASIRIPSPKSSISFTS